MKQYIKENTRHIAVKLLNEVIYNKRSLNAILTGALINSLSAEKIPLAKELCYGVSRWYFHLNHLSQCLITKPIKAKDNDLNILILIGLYQIIHLNIPVHAAVSETVDVVHHLKKSWASQFINAILRTFIRNKDALLQQVSKKEEAKNAHPKWLVKSIQQAWPQHWQEIIHENNQRAPLAIRVNQQKISRKDYQKKLVDANLDANAAKYNQNGILLKKPIDAECLPGFAEGLISIQDNAAQLAAELLMLKPLQHVLDACAAPGGKTTHILEIEPTIHITAIDKDSKRLQKVDDNLKRLGFSAKLISKNANNITEWWDGILFDRILVDAPCSATGVIRRHPDIKILRKADDIQSLSMQQEHLLKSLWPLLKCGGILLYTTCSVLPEENLQVLTRFLDEHSNAQEIKINTDWGEELNIGRQILPGKNDNMDGFYYARLIKNNL